MPLCTIEVGRTQFNRMPIHDRGPKLTEMSNRVLDITLKGLGIPSPEDRDYQVHVVTHPSTLKVSYTTGFDEYGDGNNFEPSRETIHSTGQLIQNAARLTLPGITTTVESWTDTTFVERKSPVLSASPAVLIPSIDTPIEAVPKISVTLSPKAVEMFPDGTFEKSEAWAKIAQGLLGIAADSFYSLVGDIKVQKPRLPFLAQTDASLEIDLPRNRGTLIPQDQRAKIAESFLRFLNKNALTRKGSASVWLRQGSPQKNQVRELNR